MRYYFMDKEFQIATDSANAVIKKIKYSGDGLVKTDEIISAVEEILRSERDTPTDIECFYTSFSNEEINSDYGAMMCVLKNSECTKQRATIIVNSDKDIRFQRFSLIHELGHLITNCYTATDKENRFTISAHIKYNITSISLEDCEKDKALKNEQIANIFALKVLMPFKAFSNQLFKHDEFQSIADFFGVTKDAVRSRVLLGE